MMLGALPFYFNPNDLRLVSVGYFVSSLCLPDLCLWNSLCFSDPLVCGIGDVYLLPNLLDT